MKKILVVFGTLLFISGIAYAAIPDSSGIVHGCYRTSNPAKGAVIVIDSEAGEICPSGTLALNWNQTGPQGSAGPQGPAGATGAVGPQGPAGSAISAKLRGAVAITTENQQTSVPLSPSQWTQVAGAINEFVVEVKATVPASCGVTQPGVKIFLDGILLEAGTGSSVGFNFPPGGGSQALAFTPIRRDVFNSFIVPALFEKSTDSTHSFSAQAISGCSGTIIEVSVDVLSVS